MKVDKVESFLSSIDKERVKRYTTYWETISPENHKEYYKRWIFAFCSIRAGWEMNARSYNQIVQSNWHANSNPLHALQAVLRHSRTGLYKMRGEGISKFHQLFWDDPSKFYKQQTETWTSFRNRLVSDLKFIGLAKVSFALEMGFPKECEVTCLDTHMVKAYGYESQFRPGNGLYHEIEDHWVGQCKKHDVPAPIARHIYWDGVQGQEDTRYWSYVFENQDQL